MTYKFLLYIISPTYFYAQYKKMRLDERKKAHFILKKNKDYFMFSLSILVLLIIIEQLGTFAQTGVGSSYVNYIYPPLFILFYYCFSRVNEVFVSFLFDVLEKLKYQYKISYLSYTDRMRLAFYSYLELIINYTLMFWIIHESFGLFNIDTLLLVNFLYYSCGTIATLGYGDIYATHFIPQLISVYEVFNGMLLVIVCFTIYVGLNYNMDLCAKIENFKSSYIPDKNKIEASYKEFKSRNISQFITALTALFIIYIAGFIFLTDKFPINRMIGFIVYTLFTLLIMGLLKKREF